MLSFGSVCGENEEEKFGRSDEIAKKQKNVTSPDFLWFVENLSDF